MTEITSEVSFLGGNSGSSSSDKESPKKRRTYENRKLQNEPKPTTLSPSSTEILPNTQEKKVSRYGRTRKPKVAEDYYNIDKVLDGTKAAVRESKKVIKTKLDITPNKQSDSVNLELDSESETALNDELLSITAMEENAEVDKVLKLVSKNSPTQFSPDSSSFVMKPLKTYTNRRKFSQSYDDDYPEELECTFKDSDSESSSDEFVSKEKISSKSSGTKIESASEDSCTDTKDVEGNETQNTKGTPGRKRQTRKSQRNISDNIVNSSSENAGVEDVKAKRKPRRISGRKKTSEDKLVDDAPEKESVSSQESQVETSETDISSLSDVKETVRKPREIAQNSPLRRRRSQKRTTVVKGKRRSNVKRTPKITIIETEEPGGMSEEMTPSTEDNVDEENLNVKSNTSEVSLETDQLAQKVLSERVSEQKKQITAENNLQNDSTNNFQTNEENNLVEKVDAESVPENTEKIKSCTQKTIDIPFDDNSPSQSNTPQKFDVESLLHKSTFTDETPCILSQEDKLKLIENLTRKIDKTENQKSDTVGVTPEKKTGFAVPKKSNLSNKYLDDNLLNEIFKKDSIIRTKTIMGLSPESESKRKSSKIKILKNEIVKQATSVPQTDVKVKNALEEVPETDKEGSTIKRPKDINVPDDMSRLVQVDLGKIDLGQINLKQDASDVFKSAQSVLENLIKDPSVNDYDSDSSVDSPSFEKHISVESPIFKREDKESLAQKILDFKIDIEEIDFSLFDSDLKYNTLNSPITEKDLKGELQKIISEKEKARSSVEVFKNEIVKLPELKETEESELNLQSSSDSDSAGLKTTNKFENEITKLSDEDKGAEILSVDVYDSESEAKCSSTSKIKIDTKLSDNKSLVDVSEHTENNLDISSELTRDKTLENKNITLSEMDSTIENELVTSTTIIDAIQKDFSDLEERDSSPDEFDHLPKYTPIKSPGKDLKRDVKTQNELETKILNSDVKKNEVADAHVTSTDDIDTKPESGVLSESEEDLRGFDVSKDTLILPKKVKRQIKLTKKFLTNPTLRKMEPKIESKLTPGAYEKATPVRSKSPGRLISKRRRFLSSPFLSTVHTKTDTKKREEKKLEGLQKTITVKKSRSMTPRMAAKKDKQFLSSSTPPKPSPKILKEKSKTTEKIVITDKLPVGSIVWARVGTHPYWPSIITNEPDKDYHTKYMQHKYGVLRFLYHVNFFGDNGRRSWVLESHVFPFESRNDLEKKLRENSKSASRNTRDPNHFSAFWVNSLKKEKWNTAVSEAEGIISVPLIERVEKFCELLVEPVQETKDEKIGGKRKRKTEQNESNIEENVPKRIKLGRRKSTLKGVEIGSTPKNINEAPKVDTYEDDTPLLIRVISTTSSDDKLNETNPKTSDLKQKAIKSTPVQEEIKEETKMKLADQKMKLESLDPKDSKNTSDDMSTESEINKENKLTVSNTQSPLSTQSSVTSKQKKISLFKGIPKERVCQICLKPNKVFRCKGPCCGLFHISCDRNVKINPDDSEDSNLTTDSKDSTESGSSKSNSEYVKNFNFENLNLRKDYSSDSDTSRKSNITTLESQENLHNVKQDLNCNNKDDELPKPMKTVSLKEWEIFDAKLIEFIEKPGKNEDESTNENSEPDDDSSSYEPSISQTDSNGSSSHHKFKILKHVTADGVINAIIDETPRENNFKCTLCTKGLSPPCFICGRNVSKLGIERRQKCILVQCGKFYHRECLKDWPQTKWSFKNYKVDDDNIEMVTCPHHNCHMCISDDPRGANSRLTNEKLTRCIRCPTTYHTSNYCIPAGTEILSPYQIICPKHYDLFRKSSKVKWLQHVNCTWCFICAMGGSLICCENCPASFHSECLKIKTPEGSFVCEECESGRLPLYNEIVWVKLGAYRWWPAQILYPNEVPENIRNIRHCAGEFVVRFFGSHDHYWVNRGRVFLFQDDDSGQISNKKNNVDELFLRAIGEAREMHKLVQDERDNQTAEWRIGMKPPHYVKIKSNRPVGTVRTIDANTSNTTPCDCDPNGENPCGPDSDCLNRILMTECNPLVCAAGERCCNQGFEKRQYAPVIPFRTGATGWGLKSLAAIRKGSFVIEYVGEIIEEKEYKRRIVRKHELKDENYYFLTIDKDRMIDAGPKGNVARFMNHSCSPNCETQKWTVNGDTRVGLFAIEDIPADAELTFNYNLECIGEEKKICKCGAKNCSGFIGVKAKQDDKRRTQERRMKKKKSIPEPEPVTVEINPCFICGETGAVQPCSNKNCTKYYHLHCVQLESLQEGRWMCPWHSCNVCAKRTSRSCFCCINSYCPNHSEGNIRYDETKFICRDHDTKRRLSRARKSKFIVDKRKKRYSAVSPKKILSENSASELTKVVDAEDVNEESVDSEIKLGKEEQVINKDEGEEQSRMKNKKGRSRQSQRKVGEIKDETPPDKEVQEIEANDESTKENDKIDKVVKEDESSSKGKMEKEQNVVPEKRKGRRTKSNKNKNTIEIMEKDEPEKLEEKKTTNENEKPELDDISNTDLSNNSSTSKMDVDDEPLTKRLKRTRKERRLSKFKSSADIELETSSAPKSADVELEKNNTSERADVDLERRSDPESVDVELEKRDDPETVEDLEKRNVPETVDVELEERNVPETVDVELEKLAPETVGVQLEKSNTSFIEPLTKITEIQKQDKYTSSDSEIDSNIKFVKSKSRRRSSVKKSLSSEDEKSDNIEVLCSVKNIDVTITDEVSSEENDTNLRFVDDVGSEGDGIKRSKGRSKGLKHKKTPTRKSMRGVKDEPENITDKEDESKMNEKPLDEPLLQNRLSPKKKGRRRKEPHATVEKREENIQPLPQINIKDTPVENIKKNTVQTEIKRQKGRPRKSVAPDLNNSQDKNRKEDSNVVDPTNEIGTREENKAKVDSDVAKQTDQPVKSEEISKESKDNVQTAKKLVKKQTRKSLRKEQAISSEDTSTDEGIEIKNTVNTDKKDSKESDSQDEDKGEGKEVLKPKKGRPKKKSGRKSEASNRIPVVEHVNKIILNEDEISLIKETKETDGSLSVNKSDDVPPSFTNSSKANVPEDSSTETLILKEKKVVGNPTKDFPNAEEAHVKKRERRNTEHNFKKRVLRSKVELGKDESLNVSLTQTNDVVIENVKETVPPVAENKDKTPASAPGVINQPSVSGDSPKKARKIKKRKHSDVDSLSENEVPKVAKEEAEGSSEGPRPDSTNLSDSSLTDSPKRKRGRPRKSDTKKTETETKSVYQERKMPYESAPVNEVKLTSIVPQRHLRVLLRKNSEIDSKNDSKFMKMQDDMERDLPIRKRSKLRYEAQL